MILYEILNFNRFVPDFSCDLHVVQFCAQKSLNSKSYNMHKILLCVTYIPGHGIFSWGWDGRILGVNFFRQKGGKEVGHTFFLKIR